MLNKISNISCNNRIWKDEQAHQTVATVLYYRPEQSEKASWVFLCE